MVGARYLKGMINPAQTRAGRALLNWTQAELAARSHVSPSTVKQFELGRREPTYNNLRALREALEAGGVILLDDDSPGARLRPGTPVP